MCVAGINISHETITKTRCMNYDLLPTFTVTLCRKVIISCGVLHKFHRDLIFSLPMKFTRKKFKILFILDVKDAKMDNLNQFKLDFKGWIEDKETINQEIMLNTIY